MASKDPLPLASEEQGKVSAANSSQSPNKQVFPISFSEGQHLQTICLLILTSLVCCGAAYWLKDVLVPFVLALFLTFTLRPIVDFLIRHLRFNRVVAIAFTLCLGVCIMAGLSIVVSNSVVELTSSVDDYQTHLNRLLDNLFENKLLIRVGIKRSDVLSSLAENATSIVSSSLTSVFNSLFSLISSGVIVSIYLIFLLFGMAGHPRNNSDGLWNDISASIEYYVFVKVIISLTVAVLTWAILAILDVRMAIVFGLLTFILNFIPNVGPIVAVLIPLPIIALSPGATALQFCLAAALPTAVHLISGHLVEPNVIGDTLELDPVVILLALMLAGVVWGPVGMILSVPMAGVAKILLQRIPWSKPIVDLMAGRNGDEEERKSKLRHKLPLGDDLPATKDPEPQQASTAETQTVEAQPAEV